MRLLKCDGCGYTGETGRFEDPALWIVIQQGHEDEDHLCSWSCLATFAAQRSIDQETSR